LSHNVLDVLRLRRLMLDARSLIKQPCDSVQDVRKKLRVWNGAKQPTNINQALGLNSVKCNHALVLLTGDFSEKHVFGGPLGIIFARCSHRMLYSKLSGVEGSYEACGFFFRFKNLKLRTSPTAAKPHFGQSSITVFCVSALLQPSASAPQVLDTEIISCLESLVVSLHRKKQSLGRI